MPIRMLALDLDGTLLRSDKTLSPYTLDVLHRCRSKGIYVVVATGRAEKSCARFLPVIEHDAVISNGGAQARFGDEILYHAELSAPVTNELIRRLKATDSVSCITVDNPFGYFTNQAFDPNSVLWIDYRHAILSDFNDMEAVGAYKLTVEISDEQAALDMAAGLETVRTLAFVGEDWYCYTHTGATKWNALAAVATRFGIDARDIAAFGDDAIDLEMLEHSGFGIAPANALDDVKATADDCCASNDDDGPAAWIEARLL